MLTKLLQLAVWLAACLLVGYAGQMFIDNNVKFIQTQDLLEGLLHMTITVAVLAGTFLIVLSEVTRTMRICEQK